MPAYHDDLRLGHVLADTADSITTSRFKALDLRVDTKPDLSPVSDADRGVEQAIRGTLIEPVRAMPQARRSSACSAAAGGAWIIDPIDGTKNYVRGVPVWAT